MSQDHATTLQLGAWRQSKTVSQKKEKKKKGKGDNWGASGEVNWKRFLFFKLGEVVAYQ